MTKFEEEFNYLIELSGKVLIGQVDAEAFEKNRIAFFEKYETDQQQVLPVVPSFVAEWIEYVKGKDNNVTALLTDFDNMSEDVDEWLFLQSNDDNINLILRAWLDGYTVEKPQLFYLKAKELLVVGDYDHVEDLWLDWNKNFTPKKQDAHKFTQQEIDSMETGSYELVPAEVDECSSDTDKLSVEKHQPQLNTAKKYIEHVIRTIKHDGHLGTIQTDWILPDLEKALAAIGGDDEN